MHREELPRKAISSVQDANANTIVQLKLIKVAQDLQAEKDTRHLSGGEATATEYEIGSFVLVAPANRPSKLTTSWKGPYRVIARTGSMYTLINLIEHTKMDRHISMLKLFHYDPEYTDPIAVATSDDESFVVESIVRHFGDTKKASSLQFLVKWEGQDESFNSWVDWKGLRNVGVLHEYLTKNKLKRLIPAEFEKKFLSSGM
jgi:hypothetical protein